MNNNLPARNNRSRYPVAIGGPVCCTVFCASLALASELPEIVVTAELRDTSLLQSSTSTTVVTAQDIRARSAQHLEEILNTAPNVNFSSGSSRARFFQIRGIGERSQFQEPLNPSVGLLLDGVDFSGIGTIGTLFDVEQVEVLRGPQGTLHGANALAGLININTGTPTEDFLHRMEAMAADYGSFGLGIVSSGPISDQLLYRASAYQYRSDGFMENDFLERDDTNDRDELTLRGRVRWLAGEHHGLDLIVNYIDVDNGYDAFSLDNSRHTLSDQPGQDQQESAAVSAQLHSEFSFFRLEGTLSFADTDSTYSYDEDWTYEGFHPFGYTSTDEYQRERESVSAELRLLSNDDSRLLGGRTEWVLGAYYLDNDEDLLRRYTFAEADFGSTYDTETLALFMQLDTSLGDRLNLVTGLRWESRDTQYSDSRDVDFDPNKDLWGGKIALEYRLSDQAMVYTGVSRGYRANGVNAEILASLDLVEDPELVTAMEQRRDFDEETLINYELGYKGSWHSNSLHGRLALFYMARDDQQVSGNFNLPAAGGATTFIQFTDNAAEGNNYGAEIELTWLASEQWLLWANLGLLKTEYEDYITAAGLDRSGRDQAHAPEYQYAAGGRYDFGGGFYLRLDLEGRDAFYFSDEHDERSDAYDLVHARLGYEAGNWSVALWGRNLTDEDYQVRAFGSFGNDPRNDYITEPYYQFGEPRVVGVSASYTF